MNFFKKNWLILSIIFLFVLAIIFMLATMSKKPNNPAPTNAPISKNSDAIVLQIENFLEVNDQNFATNTGTLPDSPFYFIKVWKENVGGWSKTGDAKLGYEVKLSQKRLAEVYLLMGKSKNLLVDKALKRYLGNITQIDTQNTAKYGVEITRNYTLLSLMSQLDLSGQSTLLNEAKDKTYDVAIKNAPKGAQQ